MRVAPACLPSVAFENGTLLRDERVIRTTKICRQHTECLRLRLGVDRVVHTHRPLLMEHRFCQRMRERRTGCDLGGQRHRIGQEYVRATDAIEETPLHRFIAREPLHRVHECVFGVLALESEPVDPRL